MIYKRILQNYTPLCNLLEKDVKFHFDDACLQAYATQKAKLIFALVIVAQDWSALFEVICDANRIVIGVAFGSKAQKDVSPHILCQQDSE